jgi:nucleoid DNA-binding protein
MAKKAAPKAAPKAAKNMTKGEIYSSLAESTGLSKKQISGVFDSLSDLVKKEIGKKGPGTFIIPGMIKIRRVHKPATKAKQGINPFTKQPMTIPAKPARSVVKAAPLKLLKESV